MKRLSDELPPGFEASLLQAGRGGEPSAESRARALEAAVGALAAGGAVALGAKATGALGWKVWAAFGILGVSALGAVSAVVLNDSRAPGTVAPIASVFPSTPTVRPPTPTEIAPPPEPIAVTPAQVPDAILSAKANAGLAPKPSAVAPGSGIVDASPASSSHGDLTGELHAIDQARAALTANRPSDAIHILDEYDQHHPQGSLAREAELVRIEALAVRGDHAEATRRAHALIAASPDGLYRARLRKILGDEITP